ncbi:MAG: hypothetical protein AAFQ65_02330 [Myxococcota bacterium]
MDRPPTSGWPSSEIGGDVDTRVVGIEPDAIQLPENALRLTVVFNAPVAAESALMHAIHLVDGTTGESVPDAFLKLNDPLLDQSQTRLTLVFNPGWIKRGVQTRQSAAPLVAGKQFVLIVSGRLRDAHGQHLGHVYRHRFSVGPPLRRRIDLEAWDLTMPELGSHEPLAVQFDRVMDPKQSRERIAVLDPTGARLTVRARSDGAGLSVTSAGRWSSSGPYRIVVHPELEDVSGNRPQRAFDSQQLTPGLGLLARSFVLSKHASTLPKVRP